MSEEKNNEIEMLDEYDYSQGIIGKALFPNVSFRSTFIRAPINATV